MTIIRWKMRPGMERFSGRDYETTTETSLPANCGCLPETNIRKHKDHYLIDIAAPGRKKEDFNISLEDNILTLSYEKQEKENGENETTHFLRREFKHESFSRHFTLPETTDKEKISARYENGILTVNIPFEDPEKDKLTKRIHVN